MYHAAANAYAKVAKTGQSPRDLEASILTQAAHRLQSAVEDWNPTGPALDAALAFNRRIWTILSASAVEPDNPLPTHIKVNIAQLAAVIFQRTLAVMVDPQPEKMTLLIRINREVAAGLRGHAGPLPG